MEGILASLDGLTDEFKKEYKEGEDGKFYLIVTPSDGWAFEDVSGLKSALGAEKKAKSDALTSLKAFKDIDPEAAREALSKVDEMVGWTPEQKVTEKMESMKKQLTAESAKMMLAKDEKLKKYEQEFEKLLITSVATTAIANKKAKVKGLMPHVKAATRMRISESGIPTVEVVDEAGNPRVGDAAGNLMTVEQLVDEFEKDDELKGLFPGSGASGSGAGGGAPGGGTPPPGSSKIDPTLPPAERLKIARRQKAENE